MLRVRRVLETAVYCDDLAATVKTIVDELAHTRKSLVVSLMIPLEQRET